ncbi:LysR family transcriptional regulator [Vibrio breoganii]|uniref:LysR family transcriptional regulator n=1 Tax=Vibrio breoganii TaxID=553239 RepID=UPI000C8511A8|nr:LysR family transcriptional regulator [Vibrio breoganii]PMM11061.1 LysR family transcriptional regulator [Vibrio breoganii]
MDKLNRQFYEVARQGSIKSAAEKLHISQPALTTAIKKLESNLGLSLFLRRSKGVELTDYGHIYFQYVQDLLEKHNLMLSQLADLQERSSGKIKLGVGEAWWECFVRNAIAKFSETYVKSSIHLEFGNGLSLVHHLLNDDIDLFVGHEILGLDTRHQIRFIPLFQDTEAWFVRKGHPLLGEINVLEKAQNYPLLRVTPDHSRHGDILSQKSLEEISSFERTQVVTYNVYSLSASLDLLKASNAVMPYTDRMSSFFEEQNIQTLCMNEKQLGQVGIYTKVGALSEKTRVLVRLISEYSTRSSS